MTEKWQRKMHLRMKTETRTNNAENEKCQKNRKEKTVSKKEMKNKKWKKD